MAKLTIGDPINWAEPKANVGASEDYCIQCGRKTSTKRTLLMVHVSISGTILPPYGGEENPESQGFWPVGSECAKAFSSDVLAKFEYNN
jgi:hypothetical protein